MCYGTLPRGEVQASPLLFYKFSCLEEWSYFAFFINPHLLYIGIDICSCNNIFTDKPITHPFMLLITIYGDCSIPCDNILHTFFLFVPRSDKALVLAEDVIYSKIGTFSVILRTNKWSIYLLVLCRIKVYWWHYFHFALLLSKWQNNRYHIVIVKPFSYLRVQEWTMHHHFVLILQNKALIVQQLSIRK